MHDGLVDCLAGRCVWRVYYTMLDSAACLLLLLRGWWLVLVLKQLVRLHIGYITPSVVVL